MMARKSRAKRTSWRQLVSLTVGGCAAFTTGVAWQAAPSRSAHSDPDAARIESEVLAELNLARQNPHAFADKIAQLVPLYDGTLLHRPGWTIPERTIEGAAAARAAVVALRAARPVGPLTLSAGLSRAARDQVDDQQRTGAIGHTGSDGSSVTDRVLRYGTWHGTVNESIDYGLDPTGRDVVLSLLIDDGVPDRGHRTNLLDPAVHVAGIACGTHPKFKRMCVIDLAAGFTPK